jgi:type VI secretion system protein ImpG
MGAEFAQEFPKIAGRLGLEGFSCADPYVERLLEGFAYLAARVHVKLDAEFPRFTQYLLETIYPHYLAPTPAMVLAQFRPDTGEGSLAEGVTIPRGTSIRTLMGKGEQTTCMYRTAHGVTLWPLALTEARYYTRELSSLGLPAGVTAKGGVRVRLKTTAGKTFKDLRTEDLTFYLRGSDETPMRLYEQFFARCTGVVAQGAGRPIRVQVTLPESSVTRVGFDDTEALLPFGVRSFHGYRLLHEYFAFPQRFMFMKVSNLAPAVRQLAETELDLVFLFREAEPLLENRVDASNFELFCTPAINLFPKRTDRILVTDRFSEFHVVPDRTRPLDFEVYQVLNVTGYSEEGGQTQEFRPFYSAHDFDADRTGRAYFAVNRQPRVASQKEKQFGRRSGYAGSELFIALVDANAAPFPVDLRELSVETLCTNRDLPLLQRPSGKDRTDFQWDVAAPIESVRCVAFGAPRESFAHGEMAWRLISHLSLNYLSLADVDEQEGASALRDLLKIYSEMSDPTTRKQIEGVKSIRTQPIVRRVPTPGPIAFARGLEVSVLMDEGAFEGSGCFLLGAVLDQFFRKYVSINSFTEAVIKAAARGEIKRWPVRVGQRQIF